MLSSTNNCDEDRSLEFKQFCFGTEGETKIASQGLVIPSPFCKELALPWVAGLGRPVPLRTPFMFNLEMCSSGKQTGTDTT